MDIRKREREPLPEHGSIDDDWTGTAVAEQSMILGSGDLYELAGLAGEPDRWEILGIDMHAFSHGAEPSWSIDIYAADLHELGVSSFDDWEGVADKYGGIPVVDIELHDATPEAVIKCMKSFGVRLRNSHLDHVLLHAADADHPEH